MMDWFEYHYQFGIHSNIPECCARFFQDQVNAGVKNIGLTCRPEYMNLDKYLHIRYVLCNECAKKEKQGNFIPNVVHLCHQDPNDDCKKFF